MSPGLQPVQYLQEQGTKHLQQCAQYMLQLLPILVVRYEPTGSTALAEVYNSNQQLRSVAASRGHGRFRL